jgi:hypothetical protein
LRDALTTRLRPTFGHAEHKIDSARPDEVGFQASPAEPGGGENLRSAPAFKRKNPAPVIIFRRPFDIFVLYQQGSSREPGIKHISNGIAGIFNSTRFRWFKDELIDPNHLKAVYKKESQRNLFEGFSIEGR